MGRITPEISLILVVYAALYLNVFRGAALSFVLGVLNGCITGLLPGLFVLIYMATFFIARSLSCKIYTKNIIFVMELIFACSLLEGVSIFLIYRFLYDINLPYNLFLSVFLPQSLVVTAIAPLFFALFHRLEDLLNVGEESEDRQT
jgi:rod shape-determining protein MreD